MSTKGLPGAQEQQRLAILLTGGRAPCTLELARSFYAAGHRVVVAESARYHLCRVSRAVARSYAVPAPNAHPAAFLDAIESIIVDEKVDVLIPTCEEIFFVSRGLDRLSRHCWVWAAPIDQLRELHDKWRFARLASGLGLAVPATELIQSPEEWLAYAEEGQLGHNIVLKPAYSRFASRVLFLGKEDTGAKRRRLLTEQMPALSPAAPWVAQQRIYGSHLCTYSVAWEGELLAHAAYPCSYRVGQGASVYFEPIAHSQSLAWVRKLVSEFQFTGQISFDFIEEAGGGLYAIECNPRATSGIHLFGAGSEGLIQAFLEPRNLRDRGGAMAVPELEGSQGNGSKRNGSNRASSKSAGAGGKRTAAMLAPAMLAAGLGNVRSLCELRDWFSAYRRARDVVFSRNDWLPVIEQLRVLLSAWRASRTRGITLTQATTMDLEWNGEP